MLFALHSGESSSTSSWRTQLRRWTGLDRAIALTVLGRGWSAAAGVVTVLLIARFLTPSQQGYYYTFWSLAALQIVFELGFAFVVIQLAAHERAQLTFTEDGGVEGSAIAHARLASVLKKSMRWYFVVGVLMAAILLPAGLRFFAANQQPGVHPSWGPPWSLLVIVTALTFQLDPVCAFLEGCGFVSQIAHMRLVQGIAGSSLAWLALVTHYGLFAPAMLILGNASVQVCFLLRPSRRRLLIGLLYHKVGENRVGWMNEVWPFQWKIAITWLSSYFMVELINPILFSYRGSIEAGRMGMSLSIAISIGTAGLAWMSTKASPFGNLIARGEITALNRIFFRTLWQSTSLIAIAAAGFFACLVIACRIFPALAMRVLPAWAFALLLLTTLMNHVFYSEALYLRAHKREPLLVQAVVVALVMGISTCVCARLWGGNGVTVGYFLFGGLLNLIWATYSFIAKRREWYGYSTGLPNALYQ